MAVVPILNLPCFVETRKRPLEEPAELLDIKRDRTDMDDNPFANGENYPVPPPGQLLLKVLIPGYAAGAVIGKGGQIIAQLQRDSGAIIKLSKAKDFYPGTQDRVVLIQGTAEGLMKVHGAIIEKVYEFPVPKDLSAVIGDRPKQVKIIVPNSTAGLVIGKTGATIRTIMETSGSKVQLSQKPEGVNVQERVVTIKGEKHQLVAASNIIIDKIKDDPQSASCPYISYSGISGPIANANPTGSPYAVGSPTIVDSTHPAVQAMLGQYVLPGQQAVLHSAVSTSHYIAQHPTALSSFSAPASNMSALNGGPNGLTNYATYGINYNTLGIVPGVHSSIHSGTASSVGMLPNGSFSGTMSSIPAATPILSATHFALENGCSMPAASAPAAVQSTQGLPLSNGHLANLASTGYLSSGYQLISAPAISNGITGLAETSPSIPPSNFSLSSVSPAPGFPNAALPEPSVSLLSIEKTSDGQRDIIDLSIPENLIGAILGKAGRTLVEFQDLSGARIQISRKGEYVIGTRNRRVTIIGKSPSPQTAQLLITQRIAAAQSARAQQVKLM